jgi:hypothetical protein
VHDVVRRIRESECVRVGDGELDVVETTPLDLRSRSVQHLGVELDGQHASGRDQLGEVGGDGARTTTHVEQ